MPGRLVSGLRVRFHGPMKRASAFLLVLASGSCLQACGASYQSAASPCPPCAPCNCDAQPAQTPHATQATGTSQPIAPPTQSSLVVAVSDDPAEPPPLILNPHSDWHQFQGDANRTGRSSAPAIRHPVIRWKARVGIQGYLNTPLVAGSTVFIPSSGNVHNASDLRDGVHAIDLATGRVLWHTRFRNDANGVALVGDRLVATSDDGHVYGLDATRGTVVWKQRGQGKMYSHPVVVDDMVVVGDAQGFVRAHAWADGRERWKTQMNGAIRGGIASDGNHVFVVSQGGEVAAIAKNGRARWRKNVSRPAFSGGGMVPIEGFAAPSVAGGLLIVPFARDTTYDDPAFVALDIQTGAVRWRAKDQSKNSWGNVRTTPALVDDLLVYAEPYSGDVAAIEASSGRVRYRREVGACYFPQYASPASASDLVYVPRFDGVLYAVQARSGRVLWQMFLGDASQAGPTSPAGAPQRGCAWDGGQGSPLFSPVAVASDGTILVGNGAGTVFAIGTK